MKIYFLVPIEFSKQIIFICNFKKNISHPRGGLNDAKEIFPKKQLQQLFIFCTSK